MSNKPNILLIVLHDLGTHLSCYRQAGVRSPNIDRLARDGVLFENNFATATYCSPSRGGIITGKWPHSNGLMGLVNLGWNLPPENKTLAQLLSSGGYESYLFGVQHEAEDAAQLGFDHIAEVDSRFCKDVAPKVAEFLDQRGTTNDAPFYARVGFVEVHRYPIGYDMYLDPDKARSAGTESVPVPEYLKSTDGARLDFAQFNACVEHTDNSLGMIFESLEHSGLRDNTIVVLTTDHGIDFPRAKGTLYDSGINTALIVQWPAVIEGGQRRKEIVSNIDLVPTLLDAAGLETPVDVQGRSFFPLLRGDAYEANPMIFAEKNTSPNDARRCVRTDKWKYIRNFDEGPKLVLGTCSEYSLTRLAMGDDHLQPRPGTELYNLAEDPLELSDVSGHPEHVVIETELDAALMKWMKETDDPQLKGSVPRPPREKELRDAAWTKIRARFAEQNKA